MRSHNAALRAERVRRYLVRWHSVQSEICYERPTVTVENSIARWTAIAGLCEEGVGLLVTPSPLLWLVLMLLFLHTTSVSCANSDFRN